MKAHGTRNKYENDGCRCAACRKANTMRKREQTANARTKASAEPPAASAPSQKCQHLHTYYDAKGERCKDCRRYVGTIADATLWSRKAND